MRSASGFLCVLKPPGITSGGVVARVRRRTGNKVGHAGTLDPEAAGVLPLMLGRAARLFDLTVDKQKEYVVQLIPGYETDTQDAYGRVIAGEGMRMRRETLEAALPRFTGDIAQTPPMYSAIKRDGQRLYELARRGETADVQPRPVRIDAIDILHELSDGSFLLRVACGRGTYMRTLCSDIGKAVGTRAHMGFLLRTRSGTFSLDSAHTLEQIEAAPDLQALMTPIDEPLAHLPRVAISRQAERFVRNGNALTRSELLGDLREGETYRLYLEDRFAGIGHYKDGMMRFDIMLLE